jgi:hypothetical protein
MVNIARINASRADLMRFSTVSGVDDRILGYISAILGHNAPRSRCATIFRACTSAKFSTTAVLIQLYVSSTKFSGTRTKYQNGLLLIVQL